MKKWYEVDMNNSRNQGLYSKQMKKDLKEMFKSYKENGNSSPQLNCNATFCDTFESGWFNNNKFILSYEDRFESNWFTLNTFINEGNEDFEDVSWDE